MVRVTLNFDLTMILYAAWHQFTG
jgi:hypothetical protein